MFENLKGIQKGRNIQERAESPLEKLLKIEQEVQKEYAGKVSSNWKENHDNIYPPMYQSLSLPQYTELDLQDVLIAKANNNYNDNEAQVLGMYTGVLLHVLTERMEKERKKAVYSFDLSGNEFQYLFYFAKRAGELTVKNVKGYRTCAYIASFGGTAEKVVLEGNEGDYAAFGTGSLNGNVGTLVIKDNARDRAASWAGSLNGNVGTLVINGNEGNNAASSAGRNGGTVGTLVINGNEGNNAASSAGSHDGTVGTLVIHENKGDDAASWAGSWGGNVSTLALYEAGRKAGIYAKAKRIITGEEALALYQKLEKKSYL